MRLIAEARYNEETAPRIFERSSDCYLILQALDDGGVAVIGEHTYPITAGGLYYCDMSEPLQLIPVGGKIGIHYVAVHKEALARLAETLQFSHLLEEVFYVPCGRYLPLRNSKSAGTIFRSLRGLSETDEDFTEALSAVRIIQLFNYAVYQIHHDGHHHHHH